MKPIIFAALLFLLSGCGTGQAIKEYISGEDNTEPPTPLADFTPSAEVKELWSKSVGDGTDEQYLKLTPAIAHDKVFIADSEGEIKALSAISGKLIWDKDTDLPISGGPGADDDLVLIGTSEGEVIAYEPETGEEIWRTQVSSEVLAPPRQAGDIVIVRTIDGKIFAIDAIDGQRLWIYDRTVPALTLRGTSTPVISEDIVIAGFDGGRVAALELKTGKLIWETRVAVASGRSELERMVDIDAEPVIVEGIIYVVSFQGRITAMELEGGRKLWSRAISSHAGLSVDANQVYVTDENSHVWALDRYSGTSVWKQEKLQARAVTAPAIMGDMVVVGDIEGYLHWLDKLSGEFVARSKVSGARILVSPVVADGILYAYSSDGTVNSYTYSGFVPVEKKTKAIVESIQQQETTEDNQKLETKTETPASTKDEKGIFSKLWDVLSGDDAEDDE